MARVLRIIIAWLLILSGASASAAGTHYLEGFLDARGVRAAQNFYDAQGRLACLLRTTAPDGSVNETVYDEIGKVASSKDALGRQTGFAYDSQGRLERTTYPDGLFETTGYDSEGRRITSTDRAGRTTIFGYDAMGRLSRTIAPDGAVTASSYDAAGRVLASTDARGANRRS